MFFRKFLNGLFAALFRPLAQVLLFTAAWITFLLTAPFRMLGDAYYKSKTNLFRNLPRQNSRLSVLLKILAAFIAPPLLIVLMILINPVISFVQAYRNGFKSIFDTTWLTSRVLPLVKDYFSFKKLNSTLESAAQCKPSNLKQGFVVLQNEMRDLNSMTENEQVAYLEKMTAEQDDNIANNKVKLQLSFIEQAEAHSLSGILNRFKMLLNNDSAEQIKFFELENNIQSLSDIYQQPSLAFLSSAEINLLKENKDESVRQHLRNYTDLITKLTCVYTSKSLNLITDPITIEHEAKPGDQAKIYICERAELQNHFRKATENGQYPSMPQARTHYKNLEFNSESQMLFGSCDLFANVMPNIMRPALIHAANRFSNVRINSGIHPEIHLRINTALQILRSVLPLDATLSSQAQAVSLLKIDPKKTINPNLPTDSSSINKSKTKIFVPKPTAKKDAPSPHCFKNPFRKSAT